MKVLFVRSNNNGLDAISSRQGASLHKKGVDVIYYDIKGKGIRGYLKNLIPLARSIKKEKPDVVHAHYSLSGILTSLTLTRTPVVVSLMGSDVLATNKLLIVLTRFCAKSYWKHTIVKSKEINDRISIKRSSIIPNGVDMNVFVPVAKKTAQEQLGWDPKLSHVVFNANPNRPEKNFIFAKEAFDRLLVSNPNTQMHFLDGLSTKEMVLYYNAADVLLLTSKYEGSPNVIKEAMACNCPIVATMVGDIEQVTKGTNNVILCSFDSIAISKALKVIIDSNIRSDGRGRIKYLDSILIADKIIDIYRKILFKSKPKEFHDLTKNLALSYQQCTVGLWDTTVPGIKFDEEGRSNYCVMQQSLMNQFPRGEKGMKDWLILVDKMKKDGIGKKYDCVVGISGGTDSSYLLHISHQYGLRVLAVYLDNGWGSNIAVTNIQNVTNKLNFDLETYVIDYTEVKAVLRSYILASIPWIDGPTDIAIKSVLYKAAAREKVKYALNGGDFRSEGKQPLSWTYTDTRQLRYIAKTFSGNKLRTYPKLSLSQLVYYGLFKKIKAVRPLYYLPYKKSDAKILLSKEYGWIDYGGHHHENIFTKFAISYWLPVKFGIDKRIITYSAQVLSGEITRNHGLNILASPSYDKTNINEDINYVIKKLDLTKEEFDRAFQQKNKYFYDFPSYYPFIKKSSRFGKIIAKKVFGFKPGIFEAIDQDI